VGALNLSAEKHGRGAHTMHALVLGVSPPFDEIGVINLHLNFHKLYSK